MSLLQLLIALVAIGSNLHLSHFASADKVCTWVRLNETQVKDGALEPSATNLAQCQAACASNKDCKGIDWDINKECYTFTDTTNKTLRANVTHYAYSCIADPCSPNPCKNSGGCIKGATRETHICKCVNGWKGNNCETLKHGSSEQHWSGKRNEDHKPSQKKPFEHDSSEQHRSGKRSGDHKPSRKESSEQRDSPEKHWSGKRSRGHK